MSLRSVVFALFALLAGVRCAAQVLSGSSSIVVRGRIVDSASSHPLKGAEVRLGDGGWAAFADSSGRFVLRALRPLSGRLQMRVTLFGFQPSTVDRPLRRDSVQDIGVVRLQDAGPIPIDDFQIRGHPPDTAELRGQKSRAPRKP